MLSIYSYLSLYLTGSFVSLMLSLILSYLILYISLKGQSQDKKGDGGGYKNLQAQVRSLYI